MNDPRITSSAEYCHSASGRLSGATRLEADANAEDMLWGDTGEELGATVQLVGFRIGSRTNNDTVQVVVSEPA